MEFRNLNIFTAVVVVITVAMALILAALRSV